MLWILYRYWISSSIKLQCKDKHHFYVLVSPHGIPSLHVNSTYVGLEAIFNCQSHGDLGNPQADIFVFYEDDYVVQNSSSDSWTTTITSGHNNSVCRCSLSNFVGESPQSAGLSPPILGIYQALLVMIINTSENKYFIDLTSTIYQWFSMQIRKLPRNVYN